MSYRSDRFQLYKGTEIPKQIHQVETMPEAEQELLLAKILEQGVHGFCFSIYEEGQQPGDIISEEQIRRRMMLLQPHTRWVRSFSCIEGNELVPKVAKELGMKTLVGAWLGTDEEKNRQELDGLIALAKDGLVDVAAVGNEVLYRQDLSEAQLLEHLAEVKAAIPEVPVGYVDAYYEFVMRPQIAEACDVILCNCYPYWEGTPFEYSLDHMRHMFQLANEAGKGKRVIITETGWPSQGEGLGGAQPSYQNAMQYFIKVHLWALENDIETFYFSSFDESWKVGAEGDVGAYWGVWDSNGKLKYA